LPSLDEANTRKKPIEYERACAAPSGPIAPPPFAIAAPDDALAVDFNPAALSFLRTWSVVHAGSAGPKPAPSSSPSREAECA